MEEFLENILKEISEIENSVVHLGEHLKQIEITVSVKDAFEAFKNTMTSFKKAVNTSQTDSDVYKAAKMILISARSLGSKISRLQNLPDDMKNLANTIANSSKNLARSIDERPTARA